MAINREARSMAMQKAILFGITVRLQANIKGMATRPDNRSDSARHTKHKLVNVRSCLFLYTNAITSELAEMIRQERSPRNTKGRWFPFATVTTLVVLVLSPVVFTILLEMLKNVLLMITLYPWYAPFCRL
ncbi:hypothetical protein OS493_002118 [Desmophyllum pertusum]|uniref:Uncharacterized protein n=1 Tax=Desmophyllum pertusum TaxID=174260 RepID=A0A9W9Z5K9_9CNID|nr:hypothetical protein OS493_002118 [Desmophyllum pertusum]